MINLINLKFVSKQTGFFKVIYDLVFWLGNALALIILGRLVDDVWFTADIGVFTAVMMMFALVSAGLI